MLNGKLWKVIGSADQVGGTRPVTVYEYYPNGQVQRITSPLADDPDDKVVLYDYDLAGRLRKTTYSDASTEKIIYGGIREREGRLHRRYQGPNGRIDNSYLRPGRTAEKN